MTDTSPRYEVAHLAHAELFTPNLEGTLWFFTELLGMYESERIGDSVYLRAYEDPYHHSLKVTASDQSGIGTMGWRTTCVLRSGGCEAMRNRRRCRWTGLRGMPRWAG